MTVVLCLSCFDRNLGLCFSLSSKDHLKEMCAYDLDLADAGVQGSYTSGLLTVLIDLMRLGSGEWTQPSALD